MAEGRADATFGLVPVVERVIRENHITNIRAGGDIGLTETPAIPLCLGVRKDLPELVSILEKGMAAISEAELRMLREKWLDEPGGGNRIGLTIQEQEWLGRHPFIRAAGNDNPPFNFLEEDRPRGLAVDYLDMLASSLGLIVGYTNEPAERNRSGSSALTRPDVWPDLSSEELLPDDVLPTESYLTLVPALYTGMDFEDIESLGRSRWPAVGRDRYRSLEPEHFPAIPGHYRCPCRFAVGKAGGCFIGPGRCRPDGHSHGQLSFENTLAQKTFVLPGLSGTGWRQER